MLDLIHSFVGCPLSDVHILSLPQEILLAYAVADCVVLVNARTLAFIRALAFWEVFPGTRDRKERVNCVSIEPGMKFIAAALGPYIAVWSLSGIQKDTWRVHSSLTLPGGQSATAIDCKSGLLAVGSTSGLYVYKLEFEDEILTWTRKWFLDTEAPNVVRFSPSLGHLATISPNGRLVRIYTTSTGVQAQAMRHPRPVKDFIWRFSSKSSRDDLILYTVTSDETLRIFLPVLDRPQYLQLHASIDLFSVNRHSVLDPSSDKHSSIFWLHKDTLTTSFKDLLSSAGENAEDTKHRRLKEMYDEGWDLFARVFPDGSIIVRAVANVDRRPPTLLKQFTLLHSPAHALSAYPSHLHILQLPRSRSMIIVTSPPVRTYEMDPLAFFDGDESGVTLLSQNAEWNKHDTSRILGFFRTPEGRGLAVLREDAVETWHLDVNDLELQRIATWPTADLVVILDQGKQVLLYNERTLTLTLYPSSPPSVIEVPRLKSLFSLPSAASVYALTVENEIIHIRITRNNSTGRLLYNASSRLPAGKPLYKIIPVDPMGWSEFNRYKQRNYDALLSIAQDGELSFWTFDEDKHNTWVRTGSVSTGKSDLRLASCSSAKKTALVSSSPYGEELTIWDSRVSEFASGLEYRHVFSDEQINDLDWTSTTDFQSILAVGFSQHVVLLCQQRMTYFNEEPAWGTLGKIDIGHMLSYPIKDSIWLAGGTFVIGAGHHMLQFGQISSRKDTASRDGKGPSLFEQVAWLNGPLPDYHPQMLLQCLLWGKIELVKEIIMNLDHDLQQAKLSGKREFREWRSLPLERFWEQSNPSNGTQKNTQINYNVLFQEPQIVATDDTEDKFSRKAVKRLVDLLEAEPLSHLSAVEHAQLVGLIQTTVEIDEQRRALDENGLRYLISMRSFYILNARATPDTKVVSDGQLGQSVARERLRFRDMIWASHSESQEILLTASTTACGGKMRWSDAKALGVFLWLNSSEGLKSQMEVIARNEYMFGDERDPTSCSLFYFALNKVRLVHGLWKSAAWHKEQPLMLKFLSNDFNEARWRTAAMKNAFALLGKQRFEYAAAFFLLGGSLRDAVNVCVRQLDDLQLAIAIARVCEQDERRPVFNDLLANSVIPTAFSKGNRWLASWSFWHLNRRDLAVRVLVSPLPTVAGSLVFPISDIGNPNYDDPSLALLFSQLKLKSLQTAKGTSEISGQTEFNFVLQTARVFCRMGCHALALDLVRSWSFARPVSVPLSPQESREDSEPVGDLPSPGQMMFGQNAALRHFRRRPSMVIDMDVPSEPETRAGSPEPRDSDTTTNKSDVAHDVDNSFNGSERKSGLGSLMKSAKRDISVPEFDMNAFF